MKKEINIKNNKFLLLDPTILLLKRYFCGKKKIGQLNIYFYEKFHHQGDIFNKEASFEAKYFIMIIYFFNLLEYILY